jgi:hypothetical protein
MHRTIALFVITGLALLASTAFAAGLSPEDQAFFDKHMSDFVKLVPKRLDDPAVIKCIATPIYQVTIQINLGDGGSSSEQMVVMKQDDKLTTISRPGTDGDYPAIAKMISPKFALKTDDDAKQLQSALDVIYPLNAGDEKSSEAFKHNGNEWTFVRGKFFDKLMGFVITTDDKGTVTGVKYVLKLP